MAKETNKLHVAMFPWLAFGHIIPYLELSKLIAQKGHRVSFISTPRNIDRLPKIPPNLASNIILVKIPLPKVEGLPINAEATTDLRMDEIPFLKKAFDGLEPQLTRFLEDSLPDWILYDFAPYWLPPIATKLGISTSFFSIITAWFMVFSGPPDMRINGTDSRTKVTDFTIPPKWIPFDTKVCYKSHEANWILGSIHQTTSGVSDAYRSGTVTKYSDIIILRHCNEFEGDWLKLVGELLQTTVIPLGFMPPPPPTANSSQENNSSWVSIKKWLDSQNKDSLLFVALGSEVSLSQTEVNELALGLELSGVPFFWVLRKPSGSTEDDESLELLEGFEERVKGRGIVWKGWAPQLQILGHESVGGFLTHCGWSSTIEGLAFGLPLIMLPFWVDQGLIARVFEEKQVGIEVPRDEKDGSYTRSSVAESVRLVMVENNGKTYREKAKEMSAIFGNKQLQDGYMQKFISYLENNGHKCKDCYSDPTQLCMFN